MTAAGSQPFPASEGQQRPLQQYLPRLVRFWDDEAPGARHRAIEGSMVFVDISGFTKMSERLARHGRVGAEEVSDVIGDTFDRLLTTAYTYGAGLLKFGGDALLLWFSDERHALRACASAFSMRQALRSIGVFRTTAGDVSLRMSIGIHSGVFDFFMTGASHRELIVAGPAATRTVLMESAAGAGQILISPETAALLPASNRGRVVGPGVLLRGHPTDIDRPVPITTATPTTVNLAPFVPVALRDTLLAGDLDPGHRPAGVAFLQFTNFDVLIAAEGADGAAEALDGMIRMIQKTVEAREVTFLGTDIAADGGKIILAAGVPTATGHDEEQLLLAITSVLAAPSPIPIRAGVNWGHVFAGEIGPPYRRTYTVMGDTVNLAARLMARAAPGQILSTDDAIAGSRTTFATTPLEPFLVKGKRRPIQAFSVGAAEGIRVTPAATTTPLLGRDQELNEMRAAWDRATKGAGAAIELVGDPGMGKTRLLDEFLGSVGAATMIRSECRLYQSATPYFPLKTLLRSALGLKSEDPGSQLEAIVIERAPDLLPWISLLAVPLGIELQESAEVSQLEDEFRRLRIDQSIRRLLEVSVREPTVFVIEDTHWMDEASGDLLNALLEGWGHKPWFLIVSRRPVASGFVLPDQAHPIRLQLRPLDRADAEALIIAATESSPLRPQQVAELAERADGSPLFLIELLQALRQGGDMEALPHSVEGLIGARIDKLPPADRSVLRRMAVLGTGFQADHAPVVLSEAESTSGSRASIPAIIRRLDEFLSMDQTGWIRFRHALIRDVAYAGLPFRTRQTLHAQVGDSIREEAADHPELHAELLSLHYSHARRWQEAWAFSRLAGHSAKQVYANLEAATFYRRALAAARYVAASPDEISATAEALGDVLQLAGLYADARQAYRLATARATDDPARQADLLLKQATTRAFQGSYSAAIRNISTGRRLLGTVESIETRKSAARLTAQLAWLKQLQQRPRAALQIALQAIEEADAVNERAALAKAYTVADTASILLGQSSNAKHAAAALAIFEELGDLPSIAVIMNNLGGQAYFEGNWNGALEYYAKAQEAYQKAGDEPSSAMVGSNIGELLVSQRRYSEAEPVLVDAVRVLRSHDLADAIFAESQLARLKLHLGDIDQAMTTLRRLRNEAIAVKEHQSQVEAALYLGLGFLKLGDPQAALAILDDAERVAEDDAELFGCPIARIRGQALAALGQVEEALRVVDQGLVLAKEQQMLFEEAQLLMLAASLREGSSHSDELAEKANRLLRQLGVVQSVEAI